MLGFESYRGQIFFCNGHLFRVPRSWTGVSSFQMKSSMTFVGLLHHPFWLKLLSARWDIIFQLFQSLTRVQYPKCAYMAHVVN